ncbi:uncharacterized protein PSFLO_02599 [Pseudozyma flocculosa]|uniref:Uncharacterized protein n=1 Tax=Pseudozyma flocculosa TaxID=84751 RepID=A0A5C3F0B8_9BASI|nr:uncharacterized protein PSFLO_02599 [Pseudozyma flocculosa]
MAVRQEGARLATREMRKTPGRLGFSCLPRISQAGPCCHAAACHATPASLDRSRAVRPPPAERPTVAASARARPAASIIVITSSSSGRRYRFAAIRAVRSAPSSSQARQGRGAGFAAPVTLSRRGRRQVWDGRRGETTIKFAVAGGCRLRSQLAGPPIWRAAEKAENITLGAEHPPTKVTRARPPDTKPQGEHALCAPLRLSPLGLFELQCSHVSLRAWPQRCHRLLATLPASTPCLSLDLGLCVVVVGCPSSRSAAWHSSRCLCKMRAGYASSCSLPSAGEAGRRVSTPQPGLSMKAGGARCCGSLFVRQGSCCGNP